MVIAAIAAEYNPFHNGHAHHIERTREAGASHVVAIMSGNFTQRGSPAVAEKRARARAAILGGVDLVLELPLPYAMATAQRFAFGVACVAQGMGCVDMLSFGSESGYLTLIIAAAEAVDAPAVRERMALHLETGVTFARARQRAVSELAGDEVADMLGSPNDALAVEYVRQLMLMDSPILPFAVTRAGAGHDEQGNRGELASASYLRALIRSGGLDAAAGLMPPGCAEALRQAGQAGDAPVDEDRLRDMMPAVLRRLTAGQLAALPDISEGLENRVRAAIRQAAGMEEVYALAKSKRYTAARIRRVIMAAFLGLDGALGGRPAPYIRVLGFNARGREVLARMKATAQLPVSDSAAYLKRLGEAQAAFIEMESTATDLYMLGLPNIRPCGYEFTADSVRMG